MLCQIADGGKMTKNVISFDKSVNSSSFHCLTIDIETSMNVLFDSFLSVERSCQ